MTRSFRALAIASTLVVGSIPMAETTHAQTSREVPVVTGPVGVSQVTASSKYVIWSQGTRQHPNDLRIVVKRRGGGGRFRLNPPGAKVQLGSIDGSRLIYQQFSGQATEGGTSRLRIMNLKTKRSHTLNRLGTPDWEFWPALSGRWALYVRGDIDDNSESVVLANLRTGRARSLDEVIDSRSHIQIGQINGRYAVWLRWLKGGLPRLIRYNIETGRRSTVPNNGKYNWSPSVTKSGTVYFGRTGRRCGSNGKILRWKRGTKVDRLLEFPAGIDISDSHIVGGRTPELFYTRIPCDQITRGTDIYKLRRLTNARPRPDPSPAEEVTLTVTKEGNGEGTATSSPAGIDCGSDCSETYEAGTEITLTATPADKNSFEGWSGNECTGTDPCTFTLDEDTTVVASFKKGG